MPEFSTDPEAWPTQPRFFGRRHGKPLRRNGQRLLETLLPRLTIQIPANEGLLELADLFAKPKRTFWLEVGFGGGEHLAWQATHNPDVGLIGGEVFINGIVSLLRHLENGGQENVRIFPEDIRLLIPALPSASLERVFVLFPDPWPKKRHAERRFIGPSNLEQLARLLADGGELRIGTDDAVYKDWAREQMASRTDFENITLDEAIKPDDWPTSRYEAKARAAGRDPIFLRYRRRPRTE